MKKTLTQIGSDDTVIRVCDLADGVTVIGRHESCGIRIRLGDASRRHAEVEVKGSEVKIRDLGGRNGTKLNGEKISSDCWHDLADGDMISMGLTRFALSIEEEK